MNARPAHHHQPIVLLAIIGGIASVADLKEVGLTWIKARTCFQVGTIIALIVGLVAINIVRLGAGVNADPSKIQASDTAQQYVETGQAQHWWEFLTHLLPEGFFGAFVEGDILQVIFLAVLLVIAIKAADPIGEPVVAGAERLTEIVSHVLSSVMKAFPGDVRVDGLRHRRIRSVHFDLIRVRFRNESSSKCRVWKRNRLAVQEVGCRALSCLPEEGAGVVGRPVTGLDAPWSWGSRGFPRAVGRGPLAGIEGRVRCATIETKASA